MVDINKEQDFNQKFEEYLSKNNINYLCLESDPLSIQIYIRCITLKELLRFINMLPQY